MKTAYLSLGSNLGRREAFLGQALRLLERPHLHVVRVSSVYETAPMDLAGQPWFLNLVAEIETDLFPAQLLARARRVERELGRRRPVARGPRTIDVDILLYEDVVMETPDLTIPHPRMALRRFVLEPLAELVPALRHPVLRRTIRELLVPTRGQAARRVFAPYGIFAASARAAATGSAGSVTLAKPPT
ncbi:MAG: 2-amino-4-hydroxy-6-hydroxymethyldihydropteridine diphosphokinase [Bryobacterales bacterium]|nr:2-amino-4-hydroxy-6-hydroxymethyldihydropteridine diphosphokinase [Bryobacterales bacterium]